jgi:hypothetical protein
LNQNESRFGKNYFFFQNRNCIFEIENSAGGCAAKDQMNEEVHESRLTGM